MMKFTKWSYGLAFILVIFLGYEAFSYWSRHHEAKLLERATLYWSALASHDLLTAYHLEAEAASGKLQPDEVEKVREWGVRIIAFSLGAVTYYDNHAEILVTRQLTRPDTQTGELKMKPPIKDLWTFYNGEWYHGSPEKGGSPIRIR